MQIDSLSGHQESHIYILQGHDILLAPFRISYMIQIPLFKRKANAFNCRDAIRQMNHDVPLQRYATPVRKEKPA
jgi:hypothetical protein